jgi:hypothetical protein
MSNTRLLNQATSSPYGSALAWSSVGMAAEALGWAISFGADRKAWFADPADVDPSRFFDYNDVIEIHVEMDCDGRFTSFAHIPHVPFWVHVATASRGSDAADAIVPIADRVRAWPWFDHGEVGAA